MHIRERVRDEISSASALQALRVRQPALDRATAGSAIFVPNTRKGPPRIQRAEFA
jgi:hypothetical protein